MVTVLAVVAAVAGCSSEAYVAQADEEVYGILAEKHPVAMGSEGPAKATPPFTITPPKDNLRQRLEAEIAAGKQPKVHLTLQEALETVSQNSREFQSRRESLYLAALGLTGTRNRYSLLWTGSAGVSLSGSGDDPTSLSTSNRVGASQILATGGQILGSFVVNFLKDLLNGGGWNGSSLLSLGITQSLLRGAGPEVALEPLTQGERSVIYAVRDYERYRRTLAVQIISEYLAVLRQQDSLANNEANYQSLKDNYERTQQLRFAGRIPQFQVDQGRQQLLSAEDQRVLVQARFKTSLDRFKLTLGLPVDIDLELDKGVLDTLHKLGLAATTLEAPEAVAIALDRRLDLKNARERLEDSARQVRIAEQNLLMDLDLRASVSVPTGDAAKPFKFDWERTNWELGLDGDLPLNRVPERNAYRSSLLAYDSAQRGLQADVDGMKQTIQGEIIDLDQAYRSYRIQVLAVELAADRVTSTKLFVEAGRSQVRDYLDAQQALLQSQNALTASLVEYVIAKLRLLQDLELLDVGESGLTVDLTALRRWTENPPAPEETPPEPRKEGK